MTVRIDCGPCILRPWARGDEDALLRHADDVRVWRNLRDAFPHPYRREDARQWVRYAAETPIAHLAIEVDGEAAGGIGWRRGDDIDRLSAEIGYWLGAAVWGRGIASAALRAATDFAFAQDASLVRIFAVPFLHNPASFRVLEKAGYQREGILRGSAVKEGRIIDQAMYAIVRDPLPSILPSS